MATLEKISDKTDLLYGESIVVRLEEILHGVPFLTLKEISNDLLEKYIQNFIDRLEVLYNDYEAMPSPETDPECIKYYQDLEFAKSIADIDYKDLSEEQTSKLVDLYADAAKRSKIGPHEFYKRGVVGEEYFSSLQDEIIKGMQARLAGLLPLPDVLEVADKIENLENAAARLEYFIYNAVPLGVNRDVLFQNFNKVKEILRQISILSHGKKIELVIDDEGFEIRKNDENARIPYYYSAEERTRLMQLKRQVDSIYFSEFFKEIQIPADRDELWEFSDVLGANFDVGMFANTLKKMKLSPFEELLLVNLHLSESFYTGAATNKEFTRTFLPARSVRSDYGKAMVEEEGKAYVCTGEACHAKAIFDERGNKNIQTTLIPAHSFSKETWKRRAMVAHSFLLMHLKDDKYGINTYGVYDPTWSEDHLDFILSPIEDFENFERWLYFIDHEEFSNVAKFLQTPRGKSLDEEEYKNTICEQFRGKSEPIPLETYIKALTAVIEKIKVTNFVTIYDFSSASTEEIVEAILTATIQDLRGLKIDTAKNTFVSALREFFEANSREYPEFVHCWKDYERLLKMNIHGEISKE